jgi:hypothetical protein
MARAAACLACFFELPDPVALMSGILTYNRNKNNFENEINNYSNSQKKSYFNLSIWTAREAESGRLLKNN